MARGYASVVFRGPRLAALGDDQHPPVLPPLLRHHFLFLVTLIIVIHLVHVSPSLIACVRALLVHHLHARELVAVERGVVAPHGEHDAGHAERRQGDARDQVVDQARPVRMEQLRHDGRDGPRSGAPRGQVGEERVEQERPDERGERVERREDPEQLALPVGRELTRDHALHERRRELAERAHPDQGVDQVAVGDDRIDERRQLHAREWAAMTSAARCLTMVVTSALQVVCGRYRAVGQGEEDGGLVVDESDHEAEE